MHLGEHARRAATAYGAAADHYDLPALGFWDRFGSETVARLPLEAGARVLDLCCGAGGSALPAARAAGSTGHVLGIDVAAPLLEIARARAARAGLGNAEFRLGDATSTGAAVLGELRSRSVTTLRTDVVFGSATRTA